MVFTSFAVPERWVEDDTGEIIISTATTGEQLIADLKLFALAPRMAEVLIKMNSLVRQDEQPTHAECKAAEMELADIVAELEKI